MYADTTMSQRESRRFLRSFFIHILFVAFIVAGLFLTQMIENTLTLACIYVGIVLTCVGLNWPGRD